MSINNYEISIWEDVYVEPDVHHAVPSHYVERKIAVIGSNTMESSCKAFEPKLVQNVNGTNTFSFKLNYYCRREDLLGASIDYSIALGDNGYINPFIRYLNNERKIKVTWNEQIYDFIVKDIKEESNNKVISYECTDAYINELSKTGFNLVFDNELMNNQGTIDVLANQILDGTEWEYDTNSDILLEESEESAYKLALVNDLSATKDEYYLSPPSPITFPSGTYVLWFYPQFLKILSKEETSGTSKFQFAYSNFYPVDTGVTVVDADSYTTSSELTWTKTNNIITLYSSANKIVEIDLDNVQNIYRAIRLIDSPEMVYDAVTKRYCNLYKLGTGQGSSVDVYGYEDTDSSDAIAVVNLFTNYKDFADSAGWILEDANPEFRLYPDFTDIANIDSYNAKSCLKISGNNSNNTNCNTGLSYCSVYLPEGLQKGTEYVFRYRARLNVPDTSYSPPRDRPGSSFVHDLICLVGEYTEENGVRTLKNNIFSSGSEQAEEDGWFYQRGVITESYSSTAIQNGKLAFFINVPGTVWIQEVQFFRYVPAEDEEHQETFIRPDQFSTIALVKKRYNYYMPSLNADVKDKQDLIFLYQGYTEQSSAVVGNQEYTRFRKIRTIEGSKSNRFNLLQNLAEQFGCWIRFVVNHDEFGYVTSKKVLFKKEIGREVSYGFRYGEDLKSIRRTINSDEIVTKTIVLPNSNNFAQYGSCDISRSILNPARNTIILNFDYYIREGMMKIEDLYKDLYSTDVGYVGYYSNLFSRYNQYDVCSTILNRLKLEKLKLESYLTTFKTAESSSNELVTSYKARLTNLLGKEFNGDNQDIYSYLVYYSDPRHPNLTALKLLEGLVNSKNKAISFNASYTSCATALEDINAQIFSYTNQINTLLSIIKGIEDRFFRKYARFIQEGSWQDEKYTDDNLYFLDGVAVAARSSTPRVTYDISIFRINVLEEYKNKAFSLGDITYIEDKDFFKATIGNMNYREKVTITEITYNFDSPDKDSFKVQNFKNSFDDLFQRITASVQSLSYAEGEYSRAASAVLPIGVLAQDVLLNSLNNNLNLSFSAVNNVVVQDLNGITVSSIDDPSRKVRINSMGVFVSDTGGNSWRNTISSAGIFTGELTEGNIDIDRISIYQGNHPLFRWDQKGINAYPYKLFNSQEPVYEELCANNFTAYNDNDSNPTSIDIISNKLILPFVNQIEDIKDLINTTTYVSGKKKIQFSCLDSNIQEYNSTVQYKINDLCKHLDQNTWRVYVCNAQTTGEWDSTKWSTPSFVSEVEPYNENNFYNKGDLCRHYENDGSSEGIWKVYICTEISTGGDWKPLHWSNPGIVSGNDCYSAEMDWYVVEEKIGPEPSEGEEDTRPYRKRLVFKVNDLEIFNIIYESTIDPEEITQPSTNYEGERVTYMVNSNTFVRFDRFGLYGLNSDSDEQWDPEDEDDVWSHAQFGLTWKGFFLKKQDKDNGKNVTLELSSDNDFVISEESDLTDSYPVVLANSFYARKNGLISPITSGTYAFIPKSLIKNLFSSPAISGTFSEGDFIFGYTERYSANASYSVGDFCSIVNGTSITIYKCISNVSAENPFNPAHWTEIEIYSNVVTVMGNRNYYSVCVSSPQYLSWEKNIYTDIINFYWGDQNNRNLVFSIFKNDLLSCIGIETELYNVERIKIGKFYENVHGLNIERYGILIKNKIDQVVMETDDEGNLYLMGTIQANAGRVGGLEIDSDGGLISSIGHCTVNSELRPGVDPPIVETVDLQVGFSPIGFTPTLSPDFIKLFFFVGATCTEEPRARGNFYIVAPDSPQANSYNWRPSGGGEYQKKISIVSTYITDLTLENELHYGSDERIKKDILPISSIYDNFYDAINPVTFRMKYNIIDSVRFGYIAQNVEKAMRDTGLDSSDYSLFSYRYDSNVKDQVMALSYDDFIPLNTWQIQLLKKRVAALEEKIAQLESK